MLAQLHLFPQAELELLREVVADIEQVLVEQGSDEEGPLPTRVRDTCRKLREWQEESEQEAEALSLANERLWKALGASEPEAALVRAVWLVELKEIAGACVDTSAKAHEMIIRLRTHLATSP